MDNKDIYIIGAGTYGEVMYELAELCGYTVKGFFDDNPTKEGSIVMGTPVLGAFRLSNNSNISNNFIVAIGNNEIRMEKMQELIRNNLNVPSLIHPNATISSYAQVSKVGCYIHSDVYLWTKVKINDYCIISPKVMIAHHTQVDEGSFISAGSNVGANINIRKRTFIGIGSTLMTGIKTTGVDSVIGAGSIVIKDVPDNAVVVGNPGRVIKYNR